MIENVRVSMLQQDKSLCLYCASALCSSSTIVVQYERLANLLLLLPLQVPDGTFKPTSVANLREKKL